MQKITRYLLLTLLGINIIYVISGAFHYPLYAIDVYSIWLLKAKEFYVNGVFPLSNLNMYPYSHPQYPILLPLVLSLIYQIIGEVKEIYVLIFYPLIYTSILLISYKLFIKVGFKVNMALFFTYVYSMFGPLLAGGGRMHAGEADIILVLFNWGLIHLAFNYIKDKNRKWGLLIAILISISSQIKMEGIFPIAMFLFLPAKRKEKIVWILISIIPFVIWQIVQIYSGVEADFGFALPNITGILSKLSITLFLIVREMINFRNWYVFWILFWIVIIVSKNRNSFIDKLVFPVLTILACLFIINYIINTQDTTPFIISSIDRVFLQISPFFFTLFGQKLNWEIFSRVKTVAKET